MFPLSVRIVLVLLCFSASAIRVSENRGNWQIYLIAGIFFIYEHFKGGSIFLAFQAYKKGKVEWVRKFLKNTYKPEWLRPSSRSYYYFLSAVVNSVDNDLQRAKNNLLTAIQLPFNTENMRCMVHCFLAEVYLDLGDFNEGKKLYETACNISHRVELNQVLEKTGKRIEDMSLGVVSQNHQ